MPLNFFVSRKGTVAVVFLGYMAIIAMLVSIYSLVTIVRKLDTSYRRLDMARGTKLHCSFPLEELLQADFPTDKLTLSDFHQEICLLPATDYGNRHKPNKKLNAALCALLAHIGENNFQALGKTCD